MTSGADGEQRAQVKQRFDGVCVAGALVTQPRRVPGGRGVRALFTRSGQGSAGYR